MAWQQTVSSRTEYNSCLIHKVILISQIVSEYEHSDKTEGVFDKSSDVYLGEGT